MPAIFISHSSRDNAAAVEIKSWLTDLGYEQVFLDIDTESGIGAGQNWERELYERLDRCQAVLALITPSWLGSKWCFHEVASARSQGKAVFPILFAADDVELLGPELSTIQTEVWDNAGRRKLARRLSEIADEIARSHKFDGTRPPWPGIFSFEAEDASVFFGRDQEIRKIAELLEARRVQGGPRMALIVGSSGSGKSSLMKAGVLPYLSRSARNWLVFPPLRPGGRPITSLAKAVAEGIGRPDDWKEIGQSLSGSNPVEAMSNLIDRCRVGRFRESTVLLPIDQFEEAFGLGEPEEAQAFLSLVEGLSDRDRDSSTLILATVRSDLLGEILKPLRSTISHEIFALGPLPLDRMAQVIEGPARVAGISLESGLSARILKDVNTPEALPLLAFSLRELNDRFGADRRLAIVEYEALGDPVAGLSPLENAVRRKAEETLAAAAATPLELAALKEAFVGALTRVSEDGTRLKRPASLADLPDAAGRLIEGLVNARLLTARGQGDETVVEVAHEALFRAWPQLAKWLDEEREFLTGRRQIEEAERLWREALPNQRKQALLSGLLLQRATNWHETYPNRLTAVASFIEVSAAARRGIRRRRVLAGLGAAAALGVGAALGGSLLSELAAFRAARDEEAARDDISGETFVFAARPGEEAQESTGRNGVFTGALLEALANRRLSMTQALFGATRLTLERTAGRQRPQFTTDMNGDVYLADPPARRRSIMISVGVSEYRTLTKLREAANDAADFASLVEAFGYEVFLLTNPSRADLLDLIRKVADQASMERQRPALHRASSGTGTRGLRRIEPWRPNTVLVFFYAGHGVEVGGSNYLVPADADLHVESDIRAQLISVDDIRDGLASAAAARILILDASRRNPFLQQTR